MKKLLTVVTFFLLAFSGEIKAQKLKITNNSSCTVTFAVYAHDLIVNACGDYTSNTFTIAPANTVNFNSPHDLDAGTCTSICWYSGGSIGSSPAWDQVKIIVGSCSGFVGDPSDACTVTTSSSFATACCGPNGFTATWSVSMGIIYVTLQ
jgi:hypothetical protein